MPIIISTLDIGPSTKLEATLGNLDPLQKTLSTLKSQLQDMIQQ